MFDRIRKVAVIVSVGVLVLAGGSLRAFAQSGTVIHPGDQLSVQVYGDQSLSQNVTVLHDGTIAYPLLGEVSLAGQTPEQAAETLKTRLLKYVRHPVVTVAITQLAEPNVMVLGDVKNPGKYQLPSDGRLSDAIAAAGGLANEDGTFPMARISDSTTGKTTNVDLEDLLRRGDTKVDTTLSEGDVVYVPGPVQFFVNVAGAVDHPGPVQVNQGDGLAVAIAKAGDSANAQSDLNHVRLIRTGPDGKESTTEINLYDALKSNNPQANVALQKGDTIYVPQSPQHSAAPFASGILYVLSRLLIP